MSQIKVISLLYLLLCAFVSIAQDKTDLEEFIEKGDLKTNPIVLVSTKETNLHICFIEMGKINEIHLSFASFNDQGNLIEKSYYNSDGALSFQHKYRYDDQDNLIEESFYNSDSSLDCQYKYDDQGNLIEESFYYSDVSSSHYKYKYEYDDQGNLIETISLTIVE